MRLLWVSLVVVCMSPVLSTGGFHPGGIQSAVDKVQVTALPFCMDLLTGKQRSILLKGPLLVSPDGRHKAYATVDVVSLTEEEAGDGADCMNHSILYVSEGMSDQFVAVLDYKGTNENGGGSGFQLIDWTTDSQFLVANMFTWRYGSEGWDSNLVLYSVKTHSNVRKPMNSLFSVRTGRECFVDAPIMGLLPNGRVAIMAIPLNEEEESGPSCVKKVGYWELDPVTLRLFQLPQEPEIKLNGHFLPNDLTKPDSQPMKERY